MFRSALSLLDGVCVVKLPYGRGVWGLVRICC